MTVQDETIVIGVRPELDHRAVQKLSKDLQGLHKKLGKMTLDYGKVSKQAQTNIKDIALLSSSAEAFGKVLSKSTQGVSKNLKGLKDELEDATNEAAALHGAAKSAPTGDAQRQLMKEAGLAASKVSKLNKQIENQTKQHKNSVKEIKSTAIQFDGFKKDLQSFSKFKSGDVMKGVGNALQVAMKNPMKGLGMAALAIGKGARGGAASKGLAMAEAGDMAGFGKMAKALTASTAAIAGLAGVIGGMWVAIKAASDHMSGLNKAMLSGAALAGDMSVGMAGTQDTVDELRQSAIDTHRSMLKFGGSSRKSLEVVAAFSREASGSIVRTTTQLKDMGGGLLDVGLANFSQNAIAYGKALGMEAKDVATTMGMFVSEVGIAADNVQSTMSNIVKMAATSQMPVYKFMDIFRQVTPHLNLYINRLEELTGVIKILSRTMSAKSVKKFMDAFSDGFEKVDFKQRIKMAAVIGVKETSNILAEGFKADAVAISNQFTKMGATFQEDLRNAISGGNEKAVSMLMAEAAARGASPAAIEAANEKARVMASAKKGQKGDIEQTAHAMRGAGFRTRTELTERFANKHTGGDLTGLGEHIVKQLGVSEKEYAAMLKFKASMGVYTDSVKKYGLTADKTINDNMQQLLKQQLKGTDKSVDSDEDFIKHMKSLNPKEAEKLIKQATFMSMEAAADSEINAKDMAKMQFNKTASVSEKLDSIVGYMLEKIYNVLEPMLGYIQGIFDWVSGSKEERKTQKILSDQLKAVKESGAGEKSVAHMKGAQAKLSKLSASNATTEQIMKSMPSTGMDMSLLAQLDPSEMKKRSDWAFGTKKKSSGTRLGIGGGKSESEKFMEALKKGDTVTTEKMLKSMDPQKMIKFFGSMNAHMASIGVTNAELVAAGGGGVKEKGYRKPGSDPKEGAMLLDKEKKAQKVDKRIQKMALAEARARGEQIPGEVSPGKEGEKAAKDQLNATKKAAKETDKQGKEQKKQTYETKSIGKKLSKGIKLDKNDTQKMMEEAHYKAISRGLLEFSVVLAAMWDNEDVRKGLSTQNAFNTEGVGLGDVMSASYKKGGIGKAFSEENAWKTFIKLKDDAKSRQLGGPIMESGLYNMHKGEHVIPSNEVPGMTGGGGPVTVNATFDIRSNNPEVVANMVNRKLHEAFKSSR